MKSEGQLRIYASDAFKSRRRHLEKMVSLDAPDSMLVPAAQMLARVGHGGTWLHFVFAAKELLQLWRDQCMWWALRAWWLVRYPTKTAAELYEARLDAEFEQWKREVRASGYDPEDLLRDLEEVE